MSPASRAAKAHPRQRLPWGLGIVLLVVAMLGAASLWHVVPAAWSDASTLAARNMVNAWQDTQPPRINLNEWAVARTRLEEGIAISPDSAQLRAELGYVYAVRAQTLGRLSDQHPLYSMQMGLLDLAIEQYRAACALRPTFPYTWAQLALAKHQRGQDDAELWTAFDQALRYGFAEATLQPSLTDIALMRWPTLSTERRQTIARMIAQAKPENKPLLLDMVQQAGVTLPD